jgi:hypothetical protein
MKSETLQQNAAELSLDTQEVQRQLAAELVTAESEVQLELYPVAQLVAKYGEVITAGDAALNLAESACRILRQRLKRLLDLQGASLPHEIDDQLPITATGLAVGLLQAAFAELDSKTSFALPLGSGHDRASAEEVAETNALSFGAEALAITEVKGNWTVKLRFSNQARMESARSSVAGAYAEFGEVESTLGRGPSPVLNYWPRARQVN